MPEEQGGTGKIFMMSFKDSQNELPLKPIETFSNVDTSMKLVKFPEPSGSPLPMVPNIHGPIGADV